MKEPEKIRLDREWNSDLCIDRTQCSVIAGFSKVRITFTLTSLSRSSGVSISFGDLVQRGWHANDVR